MKNRSHLFIYILINIFISAATILTVMWLWQRAHPAPLSAQTINTGTDPTTIETIDEETPANSTEPVLVLNSHDINIAIYAIVGAGNLDVEYVEIRNQSQDAINLTDWQLRDENNHSFIFPAMILNKDGAIKILSKSGANSVIELYWQSDLPIWQPGEIATLLDQTGEIINSYSIPD